jgi:hypothetical protein
VNELKTALRLFHIVGYLHSTHVATEETKNIFLARGLQSLVRAANRSGSLCGAACFSIREISLLLWLLCQDADLSVLTHLQNDIFGLGDNFGKQLDAGFARLLKLLNNSQEEFAPGYSFHTLHTKLDDYDTYIRKGKALERLSDAQPVTESAPAPAAALDTLQGKPPKDCLLFYFGLISSRRACDHLLCRGGHDCCVRPWRAGYSTAGG